jgi:hypothetical protein
LRHFVVDPVSPDRSTDGNVSARCYSQPCDPMRFIRSSIVLEKQASGSLTPLAFRPLEGAGITRYWYVDIDRTFEVEVQI